MSPKRVLMLCDRLGGGGVAQVVLNAALGIDRSKFEPVVCTTRKMPTLDHAEMLADAGVELLELDRSSSRDLKAWWPLIKRLREFDVIHSHDSTSNMYARVLGHAVRCKAIIAHDHSSIHWKSPSGQKTDRLMKNWSHRTVAISNTNRRAMLEREGHNPDRVPLVYNGIDTARFNRQLSRESAREVTGLPSGIKIATIIANFGAKKNHINLFKALALFEPSVREDFLCVVVGEGDRKDVVVQACIDSGVSDIVNFAGQRSDIANILAASDLLLLPSKSEALPITILEAMAARCPIVTAPVGGIPEILEGVQWPQVDPEDPASIAAGIVDVLFMSESERERICDQAQARVAAEFSRKVFASRIQALYEEVLHENGVG